jgi:putative transposase
LYAPQSLHRRIGLPQGVRALKPNVATADKERVIELEREVREFKRANEILKLASAFFCVGEARPQTQVAYRFVDQYRDRFGVELICKVLPIASSGYYLQAARKANPESLRARANRQGVQVARRTVERLTRMLGLRDVVRGKTIKTTIADPQRHARES